MIKKRLIGLLQDSKKYIFYQVLCQWLALLCQIVIIYEIADLMEIALTSYVDRNTALIHAVIILPAALIRFVFDKLYVKASFAASVNVKKILRRSIYEKMLSLGSNYRDYVSSSEVVQLATEGVEQLETYFGKYLSQFFYSLLAPITLFAVLCMVDITSAAILLAAVPLIPIAIVVIMKIAKRLLSKYWGVYAELGDSFLDNLNGLTTLKIYGADESRAEEMDKESEKFRKITMKVLTMQLNSTSVMDIMAYGGAAVGMIFALKSYSAGTIDISDTLMVILLAAEFFLPMRILGSYFHVAMNGMAASDKIFALLDIGGRFEVKNDKEIAREKALLEEEKREEEEFDAELGEIYHSEEMENEEVVDSSDKMGSSDMIELSDKMGSSDMIESSDKTDASDKIDSPDQIDASKKMNSSEKTIEALDNLHLSNQVDITLDDVSYSYDGEAKVLENINLTFPSGKLTSIVGLSGSGKSTIANIISGKKKGYEGSIKISGIELSELPDNIRNSLVTTVSSNSFIFAGTIYDNLRMACPDATPKKMIDVLKNVNLLDELSAKMNQSAQESSSALDSANERLAGILTVRLTEGGRNLSGGQRQRLSIARALLADTPVYIFDEATSNIDYESEQIVMDVIKRIAKSKTVILISHRLGNIVTSDNIYMLEKGGVAGSGTHSQLIQSQTSYKKMYENQSKLEMYSNVSKANAKEIKNLKNAAANFRVPDSRVQNKENGQVALDEDDMDFEETSLSSDRRSGLAIMHRLIGLIKPLIPHMILAIILGSVGFVCAISLTVLAAGDVNAKNFSDEFFYILIGLAVARGLLHYGEQYCNHYIAFRILALIRKKIFAKLRELCPAKLDDKGRGNLISIITADIEKLEVFYAHTISPIMISIIVSGIVTVFLIQRSVIAGLVALLGYYLVGVIIPFINGKFGKRAGVEAGNEFGELNTTVLESLYGLDETIQYGDGENRLENMEEKADKLRDSQKKLSRLEAEQKAFTSLTIQIINLAVLMIVVWQVGYGAIYPLDALLILVLVMSSFGPVIALSNLSNNLSNTLASGERVLSLLEEEPKVKETVAEEQDLDTEEYENDNELYEQKRKQINYADINVDGISLDQVSFSYGGRFVLQDVSMDIKSRKITAIHGPSGCGKSTILKLIMRFYDPQDGEIRIRTNSAESMLVNDETVHIKDIPSSVLRNMESYVTQETWLFHDTIRRNIEVGKLGASDKEIEVAAKKASIHDFIMSLPNGYDTQVGELGDTLSDGERQRIGVARAFLHDAPVMILDEPTSNLDVLNEGIILQSLEAEKDRSIILVSHRTSTVSIADTVWEMKE